MAPCHCAWHHVLMGEQGGVATQEMHHNLFLI